jgi:ankyrin repeat protein
VDVLASIKARDTAALRAALKHGSPDARSPEGISALRLAIYYAFTEGIEGLLAAGASMDAGDAAAMGDSARLLALVARDPAALVAPGADGFPPLHLAAHFGRVETLRAILEMGVPVDLVGGGVTGNTALHAAAAGGQARTVDALLAAGARTDIPDKNGYMAAHVAAANGSVPILRALQLAGADLRAAGPGGKTPLDIARDRKMPDAAEFLASA